MNIAASFNYFFIKAPWGRWVDGGGAALGVLGGWRAGGGVLLVNYHQVARRGDRKFTRDFAAAAAAALPV
jgi:hypothetical protein